MSVVLGRYELQSKLGVGGMAEVWRAVSKGPDGFEKQVVVKRIASHLAEHPEMVELFKAEARLAARLAHPNLINVFDYGLDETGALVMVMELVDGVSLRVLLRALRKAGRNLEPAVVAKLVALASDGLHAAHELRDESGALLGVVHRDVSPDNVLLARSGAVKVADFGIARIERKLGVTQPGTFRGKLGYAAPEQVLGDPVTRQSDVWALGATLFELLTHERPHAASDPGALAAATVTLPARRVEALRPDVPAALGDIVARCVESEPGRRWPTAGALADALEVFVAATRAPIRPEELGALLSSLEPGAFGTLLPSPATAQPLVRREAPPGEPSSAGGESALQHESPRSVATPETDHPAPGQGEPRAQRPGPLEAADASLAPVAVEAPPGPPASHQALSASEPSGSPGPAPRPPEPGNLRLIFPTPMPQQPPEVMDFGGYAPGPFLIEGAPDPAPPSAAAHERPAPAREALSAPFADAAPQGAAEPPAAATPPSDAEPPAAATPPSDAEPQSPGALARFEAATTLRPDGRLERPAPAPSPGGGLALAHPGASPEDGAALALAARAPAPSREGDDDRSAARRPADDSQAPRGGRPARRVLAGALVALVAAGLLAGAVALVASRAPSAPAGVLVIDSTPQGASIVLPDGETLGTTPWAGNNPFSVDTRVTLRRPGRRPASLVVPGGTDAHLSVVLDSR